MGRKPMLEKGLGLRIVLREDDGLAWIEDGEVVINARWLTNHPPDIDEIIEEINRSVIHEILEHILGLGHEYAVAGETLVFGSPNYSRRK